ncbi:MAG: hypothetical protein KY476_13260, partial [Planctomycetes bacterium]|nr:hypothetical protein [Planctomycetota bacterium]
RLAKTGLTNAGIEELSRLKELSELGLEHEQITRRGFESLTRMASLEGLDLNACAVDNSDLALIGGMRRLRNLSLAATTVGDAGVELLLQSSPKALQILGLQQTDVTDESLRRIHESGIIFLWLSGTAITDRGLVHLTRVSELSGLSLQSTKVSAEGVARLKLARQACAIQCDFPDERIRELVELLRDAQPIAAPVPEAGG